MQRDYNKIIFENRKRYTELFSYYNPLTGDGSLLDRFVFHLNTKETIYLPMPMGELEVIKKLQQYKSLHDFCKKKKANYDIWIEIINELREKHDFEYYAVTNIKIQSKILKKLVPFELNKPQRKYLKALEEERINNNPIRIDLLKTRQWGGSTLTEIYILWIQDKWRERWHSVLVGDVEKQARTMIGIYKTGVKNYPKRKETFTLSPYEGSSKDKILKERECIISIGSMKNPDGLRSTDNSVLHATEIGLWKATDNNKPEDLLQSLVNSIEYVPYTIIVRESTAKGVGNYWHREWETNTLYKKIFVAWYEAEKNTAKINDYELFIKSMNDYEWFLWEKGATLEGIQWYRYKLAEMGGDTWRMQSENPTTPTEAFQSTGKRVFPPQHVERMKKFCYTPIAKGQLFSMSQKGGNAFKEIIFQETPNGNLWIWEYPDTNIKISNRYVVVVDIGGKTDKADWSVVTVLDRYHMMNGGVPQTVARLRYHVDQDVLAWESARLSFWYNKALLVIENNSLRKRESEEKENHFLTVLNEIEDYYDNLYTYLSPEKIREGVPVKWGFHTNASTKPMVIGELGKALRDNGLIDPDLRLYHECESYEVDVNGAYNAVSGQHDDIIMGTAIGLHVCNKIDVPRIITASNKGRATAPVTLNI